MKKWLAYKDIQANKIIYFIQQKEVAKQVRIAFRFLQEDKIAIFLDNKLYFKCKKERLKFFKDNDKEYINVSSNKEEK